MEQKTSAPEAPAPKADTPASSNGPTNGLAIAALVVGIVAVISGWAPFWGLIVGAAAVVLGIIALKKKTGKGMAIAGIITGAIAAIWSLVVTILFVIVLVGGAAAVGTVQQAAEQATAENQALIDSKKDFAKGETANFADKFEVKVTDTEQGYNPGEYYVAEDGNQYVRVNVSVKNISDEPQYLSPYTFAILDNGVAKDASYVPVESELPTGDLAVGATTTGNVVYEVKSGATGLKLVYTVTVYDASYTSKDLTYTLAI